MESCIDKPITITNPPRLPLTMQLNPHKVGFGRHETFSLRYSWLSKGFQALLEDPGVFASEDATVTLGVGRNMVHAIRFWLLAAQLMEPAGKGFQPTPVGEMIFDAKGFDPYLEDEATLWLITG